MRQNPVTTVRKLDRALTAGLRLAVPGTSGPLADIENLVEGICDHHANYLPTHLAVEVTLGFAFHGGEGVKALDFFHRLQRAAEKLYMECGGDYQAFAGSGVKDAALEVWDGDGVAAAIDLLACEGQGAVEAACDLVR